jgi:ketosteroid isomerase-like protein
MGHPDEDLIRWGYDAFGRGDLDILRDLFQPDTVWHAPGRSQLAIGLHTARAGREGRTLQDNDTLVFHVRDGKVTEVWQYWADPYTADELFA